MNSVIFDSVDDCDIIIFLGWPNHSAATLLHGVWQETKINHIFIIYNNNNNYYFNITAAEGRNTDTGW